jgi:hypothetical protein
LCVATTQGISAIRGFDDVRGDDLHNLVVNRVWVIDRTSSYRFGEWSIIGVGQVEFSNPVLSGDGVYAISEHSVCIAHIVKPVSGPDSYIAFSLKRRSGYRGSTSVFYSRGIHNSPEMFPVIVQ